MDGASIYKLYCALPPKNSSSSPASTSPAGFVAGTGGIISATLRPVSAFKVVGNSRNVHATNLRGFVSFTVAVLTAPVSSFMK